MLNSSPSFKTIAIESNDFKIGYSTFKTELNNINPQSTQQINENTRDIIELSNKVSQNTININTNTLNIATDISNLDNKVDTNTSSIATNTSSIATNTSNIATNTSNIATNTSNIATNTSNIATNTSNIANLPNVYESLSTTEISIGTGAGITNQGTNSIAIGENSGNSNQGTNSIAIGTNAGDTSQANNTIILNAQSSTSLNTTSSDSLYIKPIRNNTSSNFLYYNNTSGEITHSIPTTITTSALPTQTNEIGYIAVPTPSTIVFGTNIPDQAMGIATLATIVLHPGVYRCDGFFTVDQQAGNFGTTAYISEGGTNLVENFTVVATSGFTTSYVSDIVSVPYGSTRTITFRGSHNGFGSYTVTTVSTGKFNIFRIA